MEAVLGVLHLIQIELDEQKHVNKENEAQITQN